MARGALTLKNTPLAQIKNRAAETDNFTTYRIASHHHHIIKNNPHLDLSSQASTYPRTTILGYPTSLQQRGISFFLCHLSRYGSLATPPQRRFLLELLTRFPSGNP